MAPGEFHSIELAHWLHRLRVSFVLRQKSNTTFREKRQTFQSLDTIPVQPGIHLLYQKICLTQKKGFSRFNLAAYWQRKYRGKQEDEPWYLLTNLPDLTSAMAYRPASYEVYSKRYGIEAMFKDCKTGGYNLEGCQASPDKLIANHDFNCLSYDFCVVTRKNNQASGTIEICVSASRNW